MDSKITPGIDELVGNAAAFPILAQRVFLNHAAVAPIPQVAAEAVALYARQAAEAAGIDCRWYRQIEELRTLVARFINADRDEIALVKNTSEGLGIVAGGMKWKAGDRIVTTAVEYPANVYPWLDLAARRGVDVVRVPERQRADGTLAVELQDLLAAAESPRTRLVALSHVEFGSGYRHDLAAVGRFCRPRGILLCVDAIQSLGALPLDVEAMQIDYLSADGHKWLLGPEGAGVFYCRKELIAKTHPPLVGWLNVARPLDFDHIEYRLRDDAARFECGTWNVPGFLGLRASIEMLDGCGIEAIASRVRQLTSLLAEGLVDRGYRVVSSRCDGEWSGIVSACPPQGEAAEIHRLLHEEHRVEVAVRAGRLRFSPHFYNTPEQIGRVLAALPRARTATA